MNSRIISVNESLSMLKDILPLEVPFLATISIGNTCDFKCIYCGQHKRNPSEYKLMTMDEFGMVAEQLAAFPKPLRQVTFVSSGETLLNRRLPDMIRIVKERYIADKVKIITNGSQLSPDYTDKLIDAGLDNIKISLQGITQEAYEKTCGVPMDFERYISNISYLYEHRKNCKVHVKVIDIALSEGENEKFYELFRDISDSMFIEHCVQEGVASDNKYFQSVTDTNICPLVFYSLFIDEHLDVFPCCMVNRDMVEPEQILGNIRDITLEKLWQTSFRKIWNGLLTQNIETGHVCHGCVRFKGFIRKEDVIDDAIEEILGRIHTQCI